MIVSKADRDQTHGRREGRERWDERRQEHGNMHSAESWRGPAAAQGALTRLGQNPGVQGGSLHPHG